jgi:hypothetical protein
MPLHSFHCVTIGICGATGDGVELLLVAEAGFVEVVSLGCVPTGRDGGPAQPDANKRASSEQAKGIGFMGT